MFVSIKSEFHLYRRHKEDGVYQRRLTVQGIDTSATSYPSRLSPSNRLALMPSLCHLRSIHSLYFLLQILSLYLQEQYKPELGHGHAGTLSAMPVHRCTAMAILLSRWLPMASASLQV